MSADISTGGIDHEADDLGSLLMSHLQSLGAAQNRAPSLDISLAERLHGRLVHLLGPRVSYDDDARARVRATAAYVVENDDLTLLTIR